MKKRSKADIFTDFLAKVVIPLLGIEMVIQLLGLLSSFYNLRLLQQGL